MELGEHIKRQLQAKGLKLNFVAEACGVSQSAMYNYTAGRKPVPEPILKLLSLQFDIETDLPESESA